MESCKQLTLRDHINVFLTKTSQTYEEVSSCRSWIPSWTLKVDPWIYVPIEKNLPSQSDKEVMKVLDNVRSIGDIMHNLAGMSKLVLKELINQKFLCKERFYSFLSSYFSRDSVASLYCKDVRKLFVQYDKRHGEDERNITESSINLGNAKEHIVDFFKYMRYIVYFMYQSQSNEQMKLMLFVSSFKVALSVRKLFKLLDLSPNFVKLYGHTLLTHIPRLFYERPVLDASTEGGELLFAMIKKIAANKTNHTFEDICEKTLAYLFFRDPPNTKKMSYLIKFGKTHQFPTTEELYKEGIEDRMWNAFTEKMKNTFGELVTVKDDLATFNVKGIIPSN